MNPPATLHTPLTEVLEIRHPVLLAPMARVSGGTLAAAVSNAGGLGIIGGGYGDPEWLETQLRCAGNVQTGVGFITWCLATKPDLLDMALARQPKAIFLSFGDAQPFADKIKSSGARLIMQVQSVAQAREAAALGADVIVAQGTEAGGHGATRATLPLVPAVVDAVHPLPVAAAGGIMDGRGLAAALVLGAAGVLMGTRFYASAESLAHDGAKQTAVAASGDHTTRSAVFDILRRIDWPDPWRLRTLENKTTQRWNRNLSGLKADVEAEISRFETAIEAGDFDFAPVITGEGVDLIHDVPSAAELIERTVNEAAALLGQLPHVRIE